MHGSPAERREVQGLLLKAASGELSFTAAVPHPSWEKPMRVAAGLYLGRAVEVDTLNLPNSHIQLPGISREAFVETPCDIREGRLHPRRVDLPDAALEACSRVSAATEAIVQAALQRSLDGLRECCELDPAIRSPKIAFDALQHCLHAHEDLLPSYH
jgi:alpha-galactosidase/6-phospho-beta-glucosidase family protein